MNDAAFIVWRNLQCFICHHVNSPSLVFFPLDIGSRACAPLSVNASCLYRCQAERLKEQASCWEKEERESYMKTHGSRQPLTKVHCKVPYRTYERRPAPSWARRMQPQSVDFSDDEADDDDDSDGSDSSPPVLTKAHAMLAAKRKVTSVVCGREPRLSCVTVRRIDCTWSFILGQRVMKSI